MADTLILRFIGARTRDFTVIGPSSGEPYSISPESGEPVAFQIDDGKALLARDPDLWKLAHSAVATAEAIMESVVDANYESSDEPLSPRSKARKA